MESDDDDDDDEESDDDDEDEELSLLVEPDPVSLFVLAGRDEDERLSVR